MTDQNRLRIHQIQNFISNLGESRRHLREWLFIQTAESENSSKFLSKIPNNEKTIKINEKAMKND